jgi:hypothetical protein
LYRSRQARESEKHPTNNDKCWPVVIIIITGIIAIIIKVKIITHKEVTNIMMISVKGIITRVITVTGADYCTEIIETVTTIIIDTTQDIGKTTCTTIMAHHVDDQDPEVNNNTPFQIDTQSTEGSTEFYAVEENIERKINSHDDYQPELVVAIPRDANGNFKTFLRALVNSGSNKTYANIEKIPKWLLEQAISDPNKAPFAG